ncbi:MAG: AraC family transcriptional regulator [Cytophagia bacterium]|nr:AraC family transcriptional regulator [Cytophagia bacterium]
MFAHMAIIRDILLGAEKQKANLKSMCEALDINPADLFHSDIQVPFEKSYRTWEVAIKHTGDPQLGLHLGERTNPSIMGLMGHLMQSCPNLLEVFQTVSRFSILATDMFTYSIATKGNKVVLSFQPCKPWIDLSPVSARHAIDHSLSGTLNIFKILTGQKISPQLVLLSYPKPKGTAEYENVFQSAIKWKENANAMVFSIDQMKTPVMSYDESLMGVFCGLIKERVSKLNTETFENKVKREIMTTFMGQVPSIESVAARFNITVRSFQRRLAEENISYRKLCHELGKDFAASLLSNQNVKITEIASTLGYSDSRAFQRAFKTWTGETPSKFREKL